MEHLFKKTEPVQFQDQEKKGGALRDVPAQKIPNHPDDGLTFISIKMPPSFLFNDRLWLPKGMGEKL
jgi:hypothetical protein